MDCICFMVRGFGENKMEMGRDGRTDGLECVASRAGFSSRGRERGGLYYKLNARISRGI